MEEKLVRFGVSVPEKLSAEFDKIITEKGYANRSEAIRDLMRQALIEREWENEDEEIVASLTIVYDHTMSKVAKEINEHGHNHAKEIISIMHVHLDETNCLEIYAMKGKAGVIKHVADSIIGKKGVKNGKLVCTTTGEKIS